MNKFKLKAEQRKIVGRKVKTLRTLGVLPSNVFGSGVKSKSIKVDRKEFEKVFKEAGETSIIEMVLGNKKIPVLVHGIQRDPVTSEMLHIDFLQIDLKKKVTASVPVILVGEAPAEKQGLGTAVQNIDEIEVEALPTDLPEKFEVDLSVLEEASSSIQVKDLSFDKAKVSISIEGDEVVVKIEELRKEEEPEPVETGEEVAEEGQEGEEGGEEGKEGEGEAGKEAIEEGQAKEGEEKAS